MKYEIVGKKIKYNCPHCGVGLSSKMRNAGKSENCPKCGGSIEVPAKDLMLSINGREREIKNLNSRVEGLNNRINGLKQQLDHSKVRHKEDRDNWSQVLREHDAEMAFARQETPRNNFSQSYGNDYARLPDRTLAIVLALLLGLFGVHKFYVGDNAQGVLILILTILLSWTGIYLIIAALVIIIEVITWALMTHQQWRSYCARIMGIQRTMNY